MPAPQRLRMPQGVPPNARQQWAQAYTAVGHKVLDACTNARRAGADDLQAVLEFGALAHKVFAYSRSCRPGASAPARGWAAAPAAASVIPNGVIKVYFFHVEIGDLDERAILPRMSSYRVLHHDYMCTLGLPLSTIYDPMCTILCNPHITVDYHFRIFPCRQSACAQPAVFSHASAIASAQSATHA